MGNMGKELAWDQFVVVNSKDAFRNQGEWNCGHDFLYVWTCKRSAYFGFKKDLEKIPSEFLKRENTKVYTGAAAFRFALSFYVGIENESRTFDTAASGQLTKDAGLFPQKNQQAAQALRPYMDAIFHDGKIIKSELLGSFLLQPTDTNTAVKMAKMLPKQTALVVGGKEEIPTAIISALNNKNVTVIATHGDEAQRQRNQKHTRKHLREQIKDLLREQEKGRGSAMAELHFVPLNEAITSAIFKANVVFVCSPAKDEETNDPICDAWIKRFAEQPAGDAKIIHLASPGDNPPVSWEKLSSEQHGFIPYSTISEQTKETRVLLEAIAKQTKETIQEMSDCRMKGGGINRIMFDEKTKKIEYLYAKPPRGPSASTQDISTHQAVQVCAF